MNFVELAYQALKELVDTIHSNQMGFEEWISFPHSRSWVLPLPLFELSNDMTLNIEFIETPCMRAVETPL